MRTEKEIREAADLIAWYWVSGRVAWQDDATQNKIIGVTAAIEWMRVNRANNPVEGMLADIRANNPVEGMLADIRANNPVEGMLADIRAMKAGPQRN